VHFQWAFISVALILESPWLGGVSPKGLIY
jgi:hypothetical protein